MSFHFHVGQLFIAMYFKFWDWAVFCTILSVYGGFGVFYGFKGLLWGEATTDREFLTGAARHRIAESALSIYASYISGIAIIGVPASVYFTGGAYLVCLPVFLIAISFANYVFVPVFYKCEINTTYDVSCGVRSKNVLQH